MLRVCHLLYPKMWSAELRSDQNIPKCYVREAGSLVESALKEDFVLFRESPKHDKAGIPSVQLRSMNWVTFNGSLSPDYLKSTVIMLLKSWAAQQDHLTVFVSLALEFSTSERGLSVVHNLEDRSRVIYNIWVSGKEIWANLLINKHPCVRTILGRTFFPEELVSNIGKSWPSKTDLWFSVLMEVSLHSGDWSMAAAKDSKYLDGLFVQLSLGIVRTATRAVERHGKIMSLGAKKPACQRVGRGMRKQHCTVPGYSSSYGRNFKATNQTTSEKQVLHAVSKFGSGKEKEIYLPLSNYGSSSMNIRAWEGDLYSKIRNTLLIPIFIYTLFRHTSYWGKCTLVFLML